jgi:hypothetical protein
MMDGSNDQGWGFLILCAVGLFTAHFLKPSATAADEPVKAGGSMGTDERVVKNSDSTDLTVEAAGDHKSADMAMDKKYTGHATVDVSSAAPVSATNTSHGEKPTSDEGPASWTRSKRSGRTEYGFSKAGPKNWGKDDKNVTDI